MKQVKSTTKCDSPKTPGGISKSLLTPCRRVGLSRNWKKSGPSPFISPLAGESSVKTSVTTPVATEKKSAKRKKRILEEPDENTDEPDEESEVRNEESEVVEEEICNSGQNVRTVELPRRKKSKKLVEESPKKDAIRTDIDIPKCSTKCQEKENTDELATANLTTKEKPIVIEETVETPSLIENTKVTTQNSQVSKVTRKKSSVKQVKEKSPNNLAKECIVVLQKKMLGKGIHIADSGSHCKLNIKSQTLFDSDSDDTPLSSIKKQPESLKDNKSALPEDDEDFAKTKTKVQKLEDKQTSTGNLKSKSNRQKNKTQKAIPEVHKPNTQCSNSFEDDDDDFAFDCKRTILIRKSYDKVSKPTKAKTTGSITEKDIEEIKERINMKKNLLLAKVLTKDTEELRGLIKKWRKGCQDALTELIELMRTKFPDRQNMDFSEILQSLRIPPALVGYDSDNDCFISPDDASIVLSRLQL